ncbi:MAG: nucleotidyltransferase family protein [Planctomycetota bacterium]|nr:MAG: nucleotidyltransferase family protein [Planctomycetota bacterium]
MIAVLLAAGAGRRIGGCKALLELGGHTALARSMELLRAGGATGLRVVLGHQADEVQRRVDLSGCEVSVNPDPDRGQTSSLKLGLGAGPLPGGACLLHTVDHPLARAEDVAALLSAWGLRAPGIQIVAPSVVGRRGHPVVLGAAAVQELLALSDDQPAHLVIRRDPARIQHVLRAAPWLVRDIDDAEDLAAARAELARRERP